MRRTAHMADIESVMGEGSLGEILADRLGEDWAGSIHFDGRCLDDQMGAIKALGDVIQQWLIRHIARGIAPEAEGMVRSKSIEPQALFALADLVEEQGYPLASDRVRRIALEDGELLVFHYPAMWSLSQVSKLAKTADSIKDNMAKIGRKVAVAVLPDCVAVTGFNVEGRQDAPAQG